MTAETKNEAVRTSFDDLFNNNLGQFGKYQAINLLLIAFPAIICGFMSSDYIFTAVKLPHRCLIPECDTDSEFSPRWIQNAIPVTSAGDIDGCLRYENSSSVEPIIAGEEICPAQMFNQNKTIKCDSFVYERTNSIVYDFNIECNEWLRALVGTLNSLGGMVALPLAGFVSDYFGRRTSVVVFSLNVALIGLIRSFSVNYVMYSTLQFMQTALGGGVFSAAYILATEIVGTKHRVVTSAYLSSMFALGQVLLGLIASFVPEWRTLTLVLFVPVFLLISYHWLLTESFRWLLSKDKKERAKLVIKQIARLNGKTLKSEMEDTIIEAFNTRSISYDKGDSDDSSLVQKIIRSPVLWRRCCVTPVWWITTTFVYYGLSINSVSLSGNMYLNYMAIAAIEIPGYWTAVLMLDRIGRKLTLFFGYLLCSFCCLSFAFIPQQYMNVSMTVYLIGKFSIALVFTSVYLYTSELYPTRHRHSLLGFSSMLGRVGSVIAPLTPPLMVYWSGIPSVMFGTMAIISALLVLTQPETIGTKLPDTIEDAERIGH